MKFKLFRFANQISVNSRLLRKPKPFENKLKMRNFVLCLSLFCILGVGFAARDRNTYRRTLAGGFKDISENDLKELEPKVTTAFEQLSSKNDDFVYTTKRLVSGKSQVVAGTRYMLLVEAAPKDNANDVKNCDVRILQNLNGQLDEVEVKCEHHDKTFRYTKQHE